MPTFDEYQQQLDQQMSPGGESGISQSAEEMARAARDMEISSTMEQQQTQQILQAINEQQQEISSLTGALRQSNMNDAGLSPGELHGAASAPTPQMGGGQVLQGADTGPTPTPAWKQNLNAVGDTAKVMGADAGQKAMSVGKRWASDAAQTTKNVSHNLRAHKGMGARGYPGGLETDAGVMGASYYGTGMGWDPTQAQSYTAASYKRALSESGGESAGNLAVGATTMGLSNFTAQNAGAMVGGAMASSIPGIGGFLAPAGAAIGGAIAKPLDAANPISWGMQESERAWALAQGANEQSSRFLRGRSGGRYGNKFSLTERGGIAKDMRDLTLDDLSMQTKDVKQLQSQMQKSGQFLGVQTGEQYSKRFERAFDNAKAIMKSFHKTAKEASDMMGTMFNDVGLNHGRQQAEMTSELYAGSTLTGLSSDQMMQLAQSGAQQASSAGMMSTTGARLSTGAQMNASQAATHTMPTDLLATMGGEKGLQQMIQRSSMQYLKGIGGTQLAAQGFQSDPIGGFSDLGQSFQSGEDILEFQTNRHRHVQDAVDTLGQEGVMAQEFMRTKQLAGRMAPGMDQEMVMRSLMGGGPKAEAKLKAMKALPETMRRKMKAETRQTSDMREDLAWERYGPKGMLTHAYRNTIGKAGGDAIAEGLIDMKTSVGQSYRLGSSRFMDWMSGVERTRFTAEEAADIDIPDAVKRANKRSETGPTGATTDQIEYVMGGNDRNSQVMSEYIDDAAEVQGSGLSWTDPFSHKGVMGTKGLMAAGGAALSMGDLPNLATTESLTENEGYKLAEGAWNKVKGRKTRRAVAVGHLVNEGETQKVASMSGEELDQIHSDLKGDELKAAKQSAARAMRVKGRDSSQFEDSVGIDSQTKMDAPTKEELASDFANLAGLEQGGADSYRDKDLAMIPRLDAYHELRSALQSMLSKANDGASMGDIRKMPAHDKALHAYKKLEQKGGDIKSIVDDMLSNAGVQIDGNHVRIQSAVAKNRISKTSLGKQNDINTGFLRTDVFDLKKKGEKYGKVGSFRSAFNEGTRALASTIGSDVGGMRVEEGEGNFKMAGRMALGEIGKDDVGELIGSDDTEMQMIGSLVKDYRGDSGVFKGKSADRQKEMYHKYFQQIMAREVAPKFSGDLATTGSSPDIPGSDSANAHSVEYEQLKALEQVVANLRDLRDK